MKAAASVPKAFHVRKHPKQTASAIWGGKMGNGGANLADPEREPEDSSFDLGNSRGNVNSLV